MTTPEKINLGQLYKDEYVAPKKPVLLDIAPATYLGIVGSGARVNRPSTPGSAHSMQWRTR